MKICLSFMVCLKFLLLFLLHFAIHLIDTQVFVCEEVETLSIKLLACDVQCLFLVMYSLVLLCVWCDDVKYVT